jgi:hypothetical protein
LTRHRRCLTSFLLTGLHATCIAGFLHCAGNSIKDREVIIRLTNASRNSASDFLRSFRPTENCRSAICHSLDAKSRESSQQLIDLLRCGELSATALGHSPRRWMTQFVTEGYRKLSAIKPLTVRDTKSSFSRLAC